MWLIYAGFKIKSAYYSWKLKPGVEVNVEKTKEIESKLDRESLADCFNRKLFSKMGRKQQNFINITTV